MCLIQEADGSVTLFVKNLVNLFNKNFHTSFLGRRESFVNPKQMVEDFRSEDFSLSFRPMDRLGYKIFLLFSWFKEDEYWGYFIREFLEKELRRKNMSLDRGETEFLPYLVSKNSAVKAFEEEFSGKERRIFGLINSKNKENEFIFTKLFIRVKPKLKKKIPKRSNYCRGYKTNTPAKKDEGERLRKQIDLEFRRKKYLYQLLFDLIPKMDEALLLAGFTDNYEQVTALLQQRIIFENELKTL